jgi:hypothetical protein
MRNAGAVKLGFIACAALLVVGCSGEILGGDDDDGADGGGGATIAFTAPAAGASVTRDQLADSGFLIAPLAVSAETTGAIVRVVFERDGAGPLADLAAPPWDAALELESSGAVGLVAIGYDAGGAELARAEVDVTVIEPTVADCHGWLDLYGLDYTLGPNNEGVPDPVTVTTPINGMVHRSGSSASPRATFFMDCTLARSLAQAAPFLRRRDVVEMSDYGVYNYRCIGGGTPPDCPNGISQHAYAKAIDIAGLTTADDTYYSVNDDWVIDPDSEDTCAAPTEPGKDQWLHETICELKANGVWNIVLTPNYNADHRNHFHVDLTTNADFIEFARPTVDSGPDNH